MSLGLKNKRRRTSALFALCMAATLGAAQSAQAQSVNLINFAGPGGLTLSGALYTPEGFSATSHAPAVVMLHGCSGMWSSGNPSATNANGTPNLQNNVEKWGLTLAQNGIVALAVDSFTPRPRPTNGQVCSVNAHCTDPNYNTCDAGLCKPSQSLWQDQCSGRPFAGHVDSYTARADDALFAYDYLAGLAGVDGQHIAQLGWSHGAQAAMVQAAATPRSSNTLRPTSELVFVATVLFYPGCGSALGFGNPATGYWRPYTDLLLNVGAPDPNDPTNSYDSFYANCAARADRAIAPYAAPVTFAGFAGAAHSFDNVSQTWPTSACSLATDDCAMRTADIDSLAYLLARL